MVMRPLVNKPAGGCVESVLTLATQRFGWFLCCGRQDAILEFSMMLEVLYGFLVRLGCPPGREGSQIAALSGLGIFLPRVQTIFAGFEFPNHWNLPHERESITDSLLYECGWLS